MKISDEGILFQPWIGKHYGNDSLFKVPILIVGESNYGESRGSREEDATFTDHLIESIISRTWNHRFFTNIQRCFIEYADTTDCRDKFWHSVAFYDYIQEWLPESGIPPTEEMWSTAKPAFDVVISELSPKCILFVCKRLYYQIAGHFPAEKSFFIDEVRRDACRISDALATYIRHPTRYGFTNSRGCVRTLIQTVGGTTWV